MATYTKFKRLGLSLTQWLAESATLVSLTGHDTGAALTTKIFVPSRLDDIDSRVPCLIVDIEETSAWLNDIDTVYITFAKLFAIATDRISALDIIGAVEEHAKQTSSQIDKSFDKNNIRTHGIKNFPIDQMGTAEYIPEARKRTERSDIVIADRHVSAIGLQIIWVDDET